MFSSTVSFIINHIWYFSQTHYVSEWENICFPSFSLKQTNSWHSASLQSSLPTWSHKKSYLCTLFSETVFTYLTAHFTAVSKVNVQWVALKHRFNTWTLTHFITLIIGKYCCVFITLLLVCIAAVQNSNIQGPLLKSMLYLSCWKMPYTKPNPKLAR